MATDTDPLVLMAQTLDLLLGRPGVVTPPGFTKRAVIDGWWVRAPDDVFSLRSPAPGVLVGADYNGRVVWVAAYSVFEERRASLGEIMTVAFATIGDDDGH